jgi:hypothetical protein
VIQNAEIFVFKKISDLEASEHISSLRMLVSRTIGSSNVFYTEQDRLCGLVAGVPDCRWRGPGCDSRRYQLFREVVGLASATEELLGRKSSCCALESREYCSRDPSC